MQKVADFMTKEIVHLGPESSISEAIKIMRERHIGAILIKENQEALGIFTERDLLTKINLNEPLTLTSLRIKDLMTKDLIVVNSEESFTKAIELMSSHKIRHTPAVKDGEFVGMVSLRELLTHYEEHLKHLLNEKEAQIIEVLNKSKESEERFRTVFNNSAVAITLTDKNERIVAWNPFAANLLGMNENDLMNKPVKELYLPEEWMRIRDLHIRQLGMKHHLETQVLNRQNKLIDVDISISVLKDALGNITGSIGIIRDIRERKKTEAELAKYQDHLEEFVDQRTEELRVANEQLRQENNERKKVEEALQKAYDELKKAQHQLIQAEKMQTVGGLATGVAHEVKNPLMIIQQGVAFLTKKIKTDDKDIRLALEHISSAVRRADRIVRGLVDFASVSELHYEKVNIVTLLEGVLEFIKHHITKNHIEVVKEFQDNIPNIDLDKNKMEQVFVDLFLNSIAALSEGGTLTIRAYAMKLSKYIEGICGRRKEDTFKVGETAVVVVIEDAGSGIPEEILDKIFDPFFTTKRTKGGTGLGLSVVKNIIKMHNGEIKIENREDAKGTRVSVYLKLQQPTMTGA